MYDFNAVRPQLEALCKKAGVTKLVAFGSAVRDDFTESSDIDLLVTAPRAIGYIELNRLQQNLEALLHRRVDLLTVGALESMGRVRKHHILSHMTELYAS